MSRWVSVSPSVSVRRGTGPPSWGSGRAAARSGCQARVGGQGDSRVRPGHAHRAAAVALVAVTVAAVARPAGDRERLAGEQGGGGPEREAGDRLARPVPA